MSLITARFTQAGLHHWPSAPPRRAYLASPHRHLFRVDVTARVGHGDRDVEFHDLAEQAAALFVRMGDPYHPESPLVDFGPRSCEVLAEQLARLLVARSIPAVQVVVSEDGESDGIWQAEGARP